MKKKTKLPQYPLVRFAFENMPEQFHKHFKQFRDKHLILLGEVEQMPGHCIVVETMTGKVHACYHTEDFIKLTEYEV